MDEVKLGELNERSVKRTIDRVLIRNKLAEIWE